MHLDSRIVKSGIRYESSFWLCKSVIRGCIHHQESQMSNDVRRYNLKIRVNLGINFCAGETAKNFMGN